MAMTKADKLEQEYEALALQIEAYERDHAAVISKYKQLQENLETTFGEAKDAVKATGHDVEGQCWRFAYITSTALERLMENITLSTNLVNAVLQYLNNQPYGAVAQLIAAIQQEATAQTVVEQQPE